MASLANHLGVLMFAAPFFHSLLFSAPLPLLFSLLGSSPTRCFGQQTCGVPTGARVLAQQVCIAFPAWL